MFAREPWYSTTTSTTPAGYALSMLELDGIDTDNDGTNETWRCSAGYSCNGATILGGRKPDGDDLTDTGETITTIVQNNAVNSVIFDFVPISSYNISITDLRFYIAPIEDPYKAFEEPSERLHPHALIVFTAELIHPRAASLTEGSRTITLFREVSTRVREEVGSYAGN